MTLPGASQSLFVFFGNYDNSFSRGEKRVVQKTSCGLFLSTFSTIRMHFSRFVCLSLDVRDAFSTFFYDVMEFDKHNQSTMMRAIVLARMTSSNSDGSLSEFEISTLFPHFSLRPQP